MVCVTVSLDSYKRHRRQVYSQHSGRIGPMSALSTQSEQLDDAVAQELQRSLRMQIYLPVGLTGLAALLGAAMLSYGAFAGLINHVLLADTLVILLLVPALIIALIELVLIMGLAIGLSRASKALALLLCNGKHIGANANRTARNYAHTTEVQFERIHRLAAVPARALRSLRQRLRGLH